MKKKNKYSYPTRAYGGVPAFKSHEEEALFWDDHSFVDFPKYWKDTKDELIFDLEKSRDATLVVRLQQEIKDQVQKLARSKGIDTSGMVRKWILSGMRAEMSS